MAGNRYRGFDFLVNHIFLPPKLPQEAENPDAGNERFLIEQLKNSAEAFRRRVDSRQKKQMEVVCGMLKSILYIKPSGRAISASFLEDKISGMKPGDVLALDITAQNAGLIIRRRLFDMVFETFELSPTNEKVLEATGRLRCSYPGPVVAVGVETAMDTAFVSNLASFLHKMDTEELEEAVPTSRKANQTIPEARESIHPKFITGMLSSILQGIGTPLDSPDLRIQKNIRDDVLWHNARMPWRRSPLWLLLRVALQTTLRDGQNHCLYKAFLAYFMADVLERASKTACKRENLFLMNAKLARRLFKAERSLPAFVKDRVHSVVNRVGSLIENGWKRIQDSDAPSTKEWDPEQLSFEHDTELSLANSESYLREVLTRDNSSRRLPKNLPPNANRILASPDRIPSIKINALKTPEIPLALGDFERWVEDCLDGWREDNIRHAKSCQQLGDAIEQYTSVTKDVYKGCPENNSIMLLTVMELWVALDIIALYHCRLMEEYPPEIPVSLFEPILVPKPKDMERLHKVETYIQGRHNRAQSGIPRILSTDSSSTAFGIRFFEGSDSLQRLASRIEFDAQEERSKKESEYERQTDIYNSLMEQHNLIPCQYEWVPDRYGRMSYEHSYRCHKCSLKSQAENMAIGVHEWPLPSSVELKKLAVFELQCPLVLSVWRDTTYKISVDICTATGKYKRGRAKGGSIFDYLPLKAYRKPREAQRVVFSSQAKSFLRSHNGLRKFPTDLGSICLPNGLKYRLHDKNSTGWVEDNFGLWNVGPLCTLQLPPGPYQDLQYALSGTIHTSNEVIAKQADCPPELSLHEYEAYGELRSGHRLQWMNIARELRSRILNWGNEEVCMLLIQAAWQAGPRDPEKWQRESHADLLDDAFSRKLLEEIGGVWSKIHGNWRERITAYSLVLLTARVLALTGSPGNKSKAADLLRKARDITFYWARQLANRLDEGDNPNSQSLRLRLVQVAAICRATYDVDRQDVERVLDTEDDCRVALECAIIIHDNEPVDWNELSPVMRGLLERNRRLSWALEPVLKEKILDRHGCRAMDSCVKNAWSAYLASGRWEVPSQLDGWVATETQDTTARSVHYNLLTGQLLIDGTSLKRLPLEYRQDKTYIRTFGDKVFDVCPGQVMLYESKHAYNGFQLHFSLESTGLLIRAKKDNRTLELIPHSKLKGDFPEQLVDDYAHWMNLDTGNIEFRPIDGQWAESERNPRIDFRDLVMRRGNVRFLDVRCPSAQMIYSILGPLEDRGYIEITTARQGEIEINLPRLQMNFFLNKGKLECRQFRDMVVDEDQRLGTLVGLENRLVLRNNGHGADSHCRKVLIPYGEVSYSIEGPHVRVSVSTEGQKTVVYHHFDVDETLWRLSGSGRLSSRLYKAYLHALTSHCLPDPLTGRTGTEEALCDLNSAAVWSFRELEEVDLDLFNLIIELAPARTFYPPRSKTMQEVEWNALPSLSQHDGFYTVVQGILQYNRRFQFFRDGTPPSSSISVRERDEFLVNRAAIRNAPFRVEAFGGSNICLGVDRIYIARDIPPSGPGSVESKVCAIAHSTNIWSTSISTVSDLLERCEAWGVLGRKMPEIFLEYDSKWLKADLPTTWCSLYDACCTTQKGDRYHLMFFLSTLLYRQTLPIDMDLIWTLLAFATLREFKSIAAPVFDSYDLTQGYRPDEQVPRIVRSFEVSYTGFDGPPQAHDESTGEWYARNKELYDEQLESQTTSLVWWYTSQWVCEKPAQPTANIYPLLLNLTEIHERVDSAFGGCYKNLQFKNHIEEVQQVLAHARTRGPRSSFYAFSPSLTIGTPIPHISMEELSVIRESPILPAPVPNEQLGGLLTRLKQNSESEFKTEYTGDLLKSLNVFEQQADDCTLAPPLETHRRPCAEHLDSMLRKIGVELESPRVESSELLKAAGLWPRITPTSLLGLLARPTVTDICPKTKKTLVDYGLTIAKFQRASRLHILATIGSDKELAKEKANIGQQGWDPMEYPDWLLLEIENNLLVRPIQATIASRMIDPPSGGSAVLQLNMGEGKSSVIVPIVSAALADGQKLVRVVVLKPLSTQMFRLLVEKLGGLINRRIFYMPFNRKIKVDTEVAKQIRDLYEECMETGGILLVQPEHMLSFKLMGFEKLQGEDPETKMVAKDLLRTSRWLEGRARDILDESDEILHVRYQLIYALGNQKWLEHSPDRWMIIQELLGLVRRRAVELQREYPKGVEVEVGKPGCFPHTRILEDQAGRRLLDKLMDDISSGKLSHLYFLRLWDSESRRMASTFIRDPNMDESESEQLLSYLKTSQGQSESDFKTLLLLRGMIAHGILLTALRDRRWRVNYGLDEDRVPPTLLAVPYRAKDCPALRAEFSHPDMAIILSCLSYYYGGLTDSQLEVSFRVLLKSNNPAAEYERWVGVGGDIPEGVRTLSGVNIDDFEQRSTVVFPKLKYRKSVIDYYLSQVVFPKDSKEFPYKLSTSGWDLVQKRALPTTGFSGTNDNRFLLPLSLKQDDVPENEGTNAKVLSYLLKEENDNYKKIDAGSGDKVEALLKSIVEQDPRIRVVLDVGAQILRENNEVATELLQLGRERDPSLQAAVYFDGHDELIVQLPDGSTELLQFSPFLKQLDKCFVYLDESHTRGTDLKLPVGSRAAVTLGPGLTKDRLVQACMRMRQLGDGHTIMYFAPPEVDGKISDIAGERSRRSSMNTSSIKAIDVVEWVIGETCRAITHSVPLWASQGLSFYNRQKPWLEYWDEGSGKRMNGSRLLRKLREPESQTLDELYGYPRQSRGSNFLPPAEASATDEYHVEIRRRCEYFGVKSLHGVRMQEEQEREVAQETEQERSIERPPRAVPAEHFLHDEVLLFVTRGKHPISRNAVIPAFESLDGTSAGRLNLRGWTGSLLVTRDFATTISGNFECFDEYLRRVGWVLSLRGTVSPFFLVVSPFEANLLLPHIRASEHVRLHVYAPRITEVTQTFEHLDFVNIPPGRRQDLSSCRIELGIFAGQLCLDGQKSYQEVCDFLGLYPGTVDDDDREHVDSRGGFMARGRRQELGLHFSPFEQNPVMFVKALMGLRRKGQDYLETHMGKLLRGIEVEID